MTDGAAAVRTCAPENVASFLGFLFFWFFWSVRYRDFLFAVEDNSLFLWRADYFRLWIEDPAGALGYAASFVIQFCHYPLLGGAVLAALAAVLQRAVAMLLRVRGTAVVFSFIPSAILAVAATWSCYYVYVSNDITTVFSGYIGALVAISLFFAVRMISGNAIRVVAAALLGILAFRHFGGWGALFLFFCAVGELEEKDRPEPAEQGKEADGSNLGTLGAKRRWFRFAFLLLWAALTPTIVFLTSFYAKTHYDYLWLLGVVQDVLDSQDSFVSNAVVVWSELTPVYLAAAFLIVNFPKRRGKTASRREKRAARRAAKEKKAKTAGTCERRNSAGDRRRKGRRGEAVSVADVDSAGIDASAAAPDERKRRRLLWELLAVLAAATYACAFHTPPFFTILAQNRALANEDWNRILELDASLRRPTEHNVALRNVALLQRRELAERAFERPIAGFNTLEVGPDVFQRAADGGFLAGLRVKLFKKRRLTQGAALNTRSEEIFCRYGLTNVAARCAMNKFAGCVGRSASCLRTLAVCAIVNGEKSLARRYLLELRQTPFHRRWAEERLAWLETPEFYQNLRDAIDDPDYPSDAELASDNESGQKDAAVKNADPARLAAITESVMRMRAMRPLRDVKELDAFPDMARLYGVFNDDFDDVSREVQECELVAALFQRGSFKTAGDGFFMANVEKYLNKYCPDGGAPKGIEQGYALLRFEAVGGDWNKVRYRFSDETAEKFGEYVDFFNRRSGALSSDDSQNAIRACCQGTYWGYAKDESAFIYF